MTQKEMFFGASWVRMNGEKAEFQVLRRSFSAKNVKKATLRVLGLGFFHCRINGVEVTEDAFLPLSTDYEPRENYPTGEILTGHRIYVPEFDVTGLLREGENLLSLHFGGGWYTFEPAKFGDSKAIYALTLTTDDGTETLVSSANDKIGRSFIRDYYFTCFEEQDFTALDERILLPGYDDSAWESAAVAEDLDTNYAFTDCPTDRVEKRISPKTGKRVKVSRETGEWYIKNGHAVWNITPDENGNATVYDCGVNITGWPVLELVPHAEVTVLFAEELNADGTPDMRYSFRQSFTVQNGESARIAEPLFTWFGFRYLCVIGECEVKEVKVVRMAVPVNSEFSCDNEVANWLYRTYLNTELCNMHAGIISDCPHIERRGYTGDGQLTCHAVMDLMDARALYNKWIYDIGDCQDTLTGHVQYTAPYTRCGGGPGGWGCAIVEVPYQYWRHYGDIEPARRLYPQMQRYLDYLEAHSVNELVVSDKEGEWCLGDWCTPIQVLLPAAFVNNYFYIKSISRMIEIARVIGREDDIPALEAVAARKRAAVKAAYFNTWDSNFLGGLQGANAYALDMGLGDARTYENMVNYYRKLGCLDTGIFGSELVPKVMFEHGDADLACELLFSRDPHSFGGMMEAGATTLWEYWPQSNHDRSHNHPMFGAPTAQLFDYLLGIREVTPGGSEIVIAPCDVKSINHASGKRTLPLGEVEVAYEKDPESGAASLRAVIPEGMKATLRWQGREYALHAGENVVR